MTTEEIRRCPRQRPGLLAEEFEDELVVCDPVREEVVVLNPMAAAIWDLCDGTRTAGEIVDEVVAALAADRDQVVADVRGFLEDMERRGLLEPGAGESGPLDAVGAH